MVVYNEIVAVASGAGLIGVALFLSSLLRGKRIDSEGWAAFFGVSGLLLFVLGVHTTVTWPFGGEGFEYANIAFGQPAAAFGALLLFAAIYLWRNRELFTRETEGLREVALEAAKPASIFVGALGLGMAVLAITFVRFQLGAAPPEEPISGRFGHLPILEALFLGGLWGIVAVGALLFAFAILTGRPQLLRWVVWAWVIGGIVFLLFGAMNFYTHIGMYHNIEYGTNHKW
ncbi:DUF981 domain-containing protein [Aeromicrobium sp.]|uniref:DUF981 domain-containing protein n=1 Tax=Aeromicrobium sp. TaxID=1871063 RepID=UPI0028ABE9B6|nr:DUF981 domain-containing protein [Aeromicrobium sp.]